MNLRREQQGPSPHDLWPDGKPEQAAQPERVNLESRRLDLQTREHATNQGIAIMREIMNAVDRYAVFASTGMYLQGKEKGVEDFQVLPGDFDAAVGSLHDLELVRDRLANVPGVQFENDGKFKTFQGEKTKMLTGTFPISVENGNDIKEVEYEFEIFFDSRMVTDKILDQREQVAGLQVLTLEGLQNQYANNLNFEAKIQQSADEVAEYLIDPVQEPRIRQELEAWAESKNKDDFQASQDLASLTHALELTAQDLLNFYQEVDQYRDMHADEDPEQATSSMAIILAGQKTKIKKRQKNLEELRRARRLATELSNNDAKKAA